MSQKILSLLKASAGPLADAWALLPDGRITEDQAMILETVAAETHHLARAIHTRLLDIKDRWAKAKKKSAKKRIPKSDFDWLRVADIIIMARQAACAEPDDPVQVEVIRDNAQIGDD